MALTRLLAKLSGVEVGTAEPEHSRTNVPERSTALVPYEAKLPDVTQATSVRPRAPANYLTDPNAPLVMLSKRDPWRLDSAYAGTLVLGSNGSGKTSMAVTFAKAFLKAGFGGLILSAKPSDRALWERLAKETGRERELAIIASDQPWRFNFLAYDLHRGKTLTERVENVCDSFNEVLAQSGAVYGGESQAWVSAAKALLNRAVTILAAGASQFTVRDISEFIASAPQSLDETKSPDFAESDFNRLLMEAERQNLSGWQSPDLDSTIRYWRRDYARLPTATRESTRFTLDYLLNDLQRGSIAEMFGTTCNIVPEDCFEGALILVDLPSSVSATNQVAQMMFKQIWQRAVMRRAASRAPLRPVMLWVDEAHLTVSAFDATFASVCRERQAAFFALSQNLHSFIHRLPAAQNAESTAKNLRGLFQTLIFNAQSDPDTIKLAVELAGKHVVTRATDTEGESAGESKQAGQGDQGGRKGPGRQAGTGRETGTNRSRALQQVVEDWLRPEQLTALKTGGERNGYRVGAYVFTTRDTWKRTDRSMLYSEFDQRI